MTPREEGLPKGASNSICVLAEAAASLWNIAAADRSMRCSPFAAPCASDKLLHTYPHISRSHPHPEPYDTQGEGNRRHGTCSSDASVPSAGFSMGAYTYTPFVGPQAVVTYVGSSMLRAF